MNIIKEDKGFLNHLNKLRNSYNIYENGEVHMEVLYKGDVSVVKFDKIHLPKVRQKNGHDKYMTWYLQKNGYVTSQINKKNICLHNLIIGETPDGYSVDHIDRNKLNNLDTNLRFATPLEQTLNSHRVIKGTKQKLRNDTSEINKKTLQENGIEMPQYVSYRSQTIKSGIVMSLFRIRCHPYQKENNINSWSTTRSSKVCINKKFEEVINKLKEYENDNQAQN